MNDALGQLLGEHSLAILLLLNASISWLLIVNQKLRPRSKVLCLVAVWIFPLIGAILAVALSSPNGIGPGAALLEKSLTPTEASKDFQIHTLRKMRRRETTSESKS